MLACLVILVAALLILLYIMSFAVRVKMGGLIKGLIIYKVLAWVWRLIRSVCHAMAQELVRGMPSVPKTCVAVAVILLSGAYLHEQRRSVAHHKRAAGCGADIHGDMREKAADRGAEARRGDESCVVDTSKLYGPFREHGEDLNTIRDGVSLAVEVRMR